MSLTEFIDMGGYAVYVWSSYGIALVVLVANLVLPLSEHRKLRARLRRKLRQVRSDS
jgi:heme exporter protein D